VKKKHQSAVNLPTSSLLFRPDGGKRPFCTKSDKKTPQIKFYSYLCTGFPKGWKAAKQEKHCNTVLNLEFRQNSKMGGLSIYAFA